MEDPERGGPPPEGGAPRDILPGPGGNPSAAGGEGRRAAQPADKGRPGHGVPPQRPIGKRRHKRRRGRKVFARDEAALGARAAASPDSPPAPESPRERSAGTAGEKNSPDAVRTNGHAFEPAPPVRGPARLLPVYAALDLGTNNCRLLVAIPSWPGQFRVIDAFSRIVRLGEGLSASGRLGDRAMERAIEALKVCAAKLGSREIRRVRLIATEACRSAENGLLFLDRVEAETGLRLEIVDRETEARLAVSGCGSLIERDTHGVVLFDIGGGSSEIALVDLSGARTARLADHIVSWTSLPVGVVSLAERFGGRQVSGETFAAMVGEVRAMLESFDGRDRLAHLIESDRFHLLGTSGTVTTLAGIYLGLERYDRRRVDGIWMRAEDIDGMTARLLSWEYHQRVANPCIGADRADLVLAGCAILEAIRLTWPSRRLRVADRGLREGILTELMAEDGAWRTSRRRARWGS